MKPLSIHPLICVPYRLVLLAIGMLCLNMSQSISQLNDVSALYNINTDHTGGYLGTGLSFRDFNNDGKDDLSFGHHAGELKFYGGTGEGFNAVIFDLELPVAESKAIIWVDLDNDDDQDLLVTYRLAPNKIYLNQGDMSFLDVSATCGIAQDLRRSFGACFGDFDNDGLLDLFISNYGYATDVPEGNELYRNLGNGLFEDVTAEFGLGGANLQCFQGQWMDVDRDGWLDLHVIRDRFIYPNLVYRNLGGQGMNLFEEVAPEIGMDVAINCMSTSPHDFDRDGDLDVFLSGGLEGNVLLENTDEWEFEVVDQPLLELNEVCWASQWLDVDCDGWEDLHVSTGLAAYNNYPAVLTQNPDEPDALFMNDEGGFIQDVEMFQSLSVLGFATATSDFNGDGFVDLVSHQIGVEAQVMTSEPNGNHWMKVRPVGVISNRDGVGVQLELWVDGLRSYRETYCGENFLGQNSQWEHFGLGSNEIVDSLLVRWPSGIVDAYFDISVNYNLTVTEGEMAGLCLSECLGCMYDSACNYDEVATIDDGSCDFTCWFNEVLCGPGLIWNLEEQECEDGCAADVNDDDVVDIEDLLLLLASFASFCEP
ncbi:MAG: CRTAC1 family protein [Flavobacteriales bacterium]|nr:CRTAC1 family protein [Flavobacteriales bacterium]